MLHRARFFNFLLNLLYALQLSGTALGSSTLATHQLTYFRRVLNEARNQKLFSLLFKTIYKHVIDISWCQIWLGSIQTLV